MNEPQKLSVLEEYSARSEQPLPPHRVVQCARCGEVLCVGEGYYHLRGFPYCAFCIDTMEVEELVRICEIPKHQWLKQMGLSFECIEEFGGAPRGEAE